MILKQAKTLNTTVAYLVGIAVPGISSTCKLHKAHVMGGGKPDYRAGATPEFNYRVKLENGEEHTLPSTLIWNYQEDLIGFHAGVNGCVISACLVRSVVVDEDGKVEIHLKCPEWLEKEMDVSVKTPFRLKKDAKFDYLFNVKRYSYKNGEVELVIESYNSETYRYLEEVALHELREKVFTTSHIRYE